MNKALNLDIQTAWQTGRSLLLPTSPTPDLDARLLLEHVLQRPYSYLTAHGDEVVTAVDQQTYQSLLQRAQAKEPIPYIIGSCNFYGLEFFVTTDVLIPRPETEQLVELVLDWAKQHNPATMVDVGTGSGCIAISLAIHFPQATVTAVDLSPAALAIAQKNSEHLAASHLFFSHGDLLQSVNGPIDLIVANLPYVADDEWTSVDDGVKLYEPLMALDGGVDGLDLVRELLQQATEKMSSQGAIFLEIGWQQGAAAMAMARSQFPQAMLELKADYAGHDRFIVIQL